MIMIAHRGFWKATQEQNTMLAFERAFMHGYGIETDLRDHHGSLVISHDLPDQNPITFDSLLDLYAKYKNLYPLAINIKADGLRELLQKKMLANQVTNYFVFDMSVPDAVHFFRHGVPCFTRQSEYELTPSFYAEAQGVWIDEFNSHWVKNKMLFDHLSNGKKICLVSPELHGRSYEEEWLQYKEISIKSPKETVMICTDYPDLADNFFNVT